jgi:hypothetical protein
MPSLTIAGDGPPKHLVMEGGVCGVLTIDFGQ